VLSENNKYRYSQLLKPRYIQITASSLLLLLLLAAHPAVQAEETVPPADNTTETAKTLTAPVDNKLPDQSTATETPCETEKVQTVREPGWYDSAHEAMNIVFCEPAIWFDNFFASDRVIEEVGGTYVRWRNDFRQNEEDGFDFQTNLNFSVELPKISRRLKLTFEGDDDQELRDVLPGDTEQDQGNTLGLRLDVKDTDRSKFNVTVSGTPRIRARYRYTYPVFEDFLIRFTQEVQNEEGINGARTRLDFEKAFLPFKLLRSSTEGFVSEEYNGVDWSQAFSLFQRLDRKSSVSYEASAVGITQPESLVTNYRLGVRYRQNIHRDWLFFEITPDVTWPIDLSEDRETITRERRSVISIIIRLEVHFSTARKRKYSDYIY
jgi:hypothetical protein